MPRGNKRRTDQKRIHDTTGQWRTVSNAFGEPSISPVEALAENAYIAQKSQRLIIPTSSVAFLITSAIAIDMKGTT